MRILTVSTLIILVTSTDLPATDKSAPTPSPAVSVTDAPEAEQPRIRPASSERNLLVEGSIFDATFNLLLPPGADDGTSQTLQDAESRSATGESAGLAQPAAGPAALLQPAAERAEQATAEAPPRVFSRETICDSLVTAATEHNLPVVFFTRLIWQESRFNPNSVSRAGAQGVAQFMPASAADMGLADPFDPVQALPVSARFLRELRRQFGNWGLAAAAYNAGPGRVRSWLSRRSKLPRETRDYVMKITGHAPERWAGTQPRKALLTTPERVPCQNIPEEMASADITAVPMPPERPRVDAVDGQSERVVVASADDSGFALPRRRTPAAHVAQHVAQHVAHRVAHAPEPPASRPTTRPWSARIAARRAPARSQPTQNTTARAAPAIRIKSAGRLHAPRRARITIAMRGRG